MYQDCIRSTSFIDQLTCNQTMHSTEWIFQTRNIQWLHTADHGERSHLRCSKQFSFLKRKCYLKCTHNFSCKIRNNKKKKTQYTDSKPFCPSVYFVTQVNKFQIQAIIRQHRFGLHVGIYIFKLNIIILISHLNKYAPLVINFHTVWV